MPRRLLHALAAVALTSVLGMTPVSGMGAQNELYPNTAYRGRAAVEYQDGDLKLVAAYYYSQREHDSRWLLVEMAASAPRPIQINRSDISLFTPDGREVPVASQREFRRDHLRTRPLIQEATSSRHPVHDYFAVKESRPFQWFMLESQGIIHDFFDLNEWQIAAGDLFFASPTGAWEDGLYSLVVNGPDGARAMVPIELQ